MVWMKVKLMSGSNDSVKARVVVESANPVVVTRLSRNNPHALSVVIALGLIRASETKTKLHRIAFA